MDILVEAEARVQHVILNRPAKRNALTMMMCNDIANAVTAAECNEDIGCTLIRANGSVFSAGMDLNEKVPVESLTLSHEQLFTMGARARKPIVVAVNGAALAGGLGLVAQGHIVLASRNATFGLPEVKIGFWPFVVYRAMEAALGKRRLLELSLTGASFSAEDALAWGLVHRIHSEAELQDSATKFAQDIAAASPVAISLGMQYVREAEGMSLWEAGELAGRLRAKLMASGDYEEGTAAFKEKREPRWPSAAGRS